MANDYNTVPASVYASWPAPNYINPVRRTWLPAFAVTWQVLSTLLVAGRFYLRARNQAGSFGLDDAMIFFAWLFAIGLTTGEYYSATFYGMDRHTWDLHPPMYAGLALTGWVNQVMFTVSSVCTKLSVLLFYRRTMIDTLDRRWIYALWSAIGFTVAYGTTLLVAMFLFCRPLNAVWRSFEPGYDADYTCFDGSQLTLASGVLGTLSDVYAVALPCLMLQSYNLDVSRRQKVALNMIFCLGLLVTGCGIARTYYQWKSINAYDATWTGFELQVWSIIECQLGIICACAPSLRAFFRRYLRDGIKKTFGSAAKSVTHYKSNDQEGTAGVASSRRDTRSYVDLEDLESNGCGGTTAPPREPDAAWTGPETDEDEVLERFPTPVITTPDDYEAYAIARLSMLSRRSYPALYQASAAKKVETVGPGTKRIAGGDVQLDFDVPELRL